MNLSLKRKAGDTMSDATKPTKQKRGYKVNGVKLEYDLRVRIDSDTAKRLAEYAQRQHQTRAAAARDILRDALQGK